MRLRVGLRRWWLLPLIPLSALAPAARADIGQFLGFERPLLVGGLSDALSIDIGADGRTDLLVDGFGILNGSERLDNALTLLVRQPSGEWNRKEELPGGSPAVIDLDQDGREDLVLEYGARLLYWRQNRDGLLEQAGADTIPSAWDVRGVSRLFPIGEGRVLWLAYDESGAIREGPLRALLFRWNGTGGGLHLAWADTLRNSDELWFDGGGVASVSGVPYVIGRSSSFALWATPITEEGPGAPVYSRALEGLGSLDLVAVRSEGGGRVLLWPRSEGDTYYEAVPGPDSISLRAGRVAGMPQLTRSGTPAVLSRADGTSTIAFPRVDSLGHCLAYVQVDGSLPPRHLANARIEDSNLEAVLDAPGRLEVLASTNYGAIVASSEPHPAREPDIPCQIRAGIAMSDVDGDGIPDLILAGRSQGGGDALWISRGIDRAPWFATPEEIPIAEDITGLSVALGDLDGDGERDLVTISHPSDPGLVRVHPYFQVEGGFEPGTPVDISDVQSLSIRGLGDFDGDGRTEVSYQVNLYGEAVRLLRWNRDRSVDAAVGDIGDLHGAPVATGDFDGDGKDEALVSMSGILSIVRLYPDERTYQVFTNSGIPANTDYQWAGDMDGDGRAELYVERTTGFLCAFSPDGRIRTLRENILRNYRSRYPAPCLIDIDGDGVPELVSTVSGDGSIEITHDVTAPDAEPIVWLAPDGLHPASGVRLFWRDVDRDGDPDPIFICDDGIRVGKNEAIGPAPTRSQDGMLRLVARTPAGTSARVAVRIARPGPIALHLYDVAGRAVWGERRDSAPANEWVEFVVAPKPAEGAIARGVYFLKVVGGGHAATRRILLGF